MDGITAVILRTTLCTFIAAAIAKVLLSWRPVRSPRIHRIVWTLVLLQGWLLFPFIVTVSIGPRTYDVPVSDSLEEVPASITAAIDEESTGVNRPNFSQFSWMGLIWIGGAISIVTRFFMRYASLVRNIPLGRELTNAQWIAEWDKAVREADVRDDTHFRLSDNVGPLCCYVPFFFLVLAPKRMWETLDSKERSLILRHELAHVSRRDLWKSLAIRILALPQWFNPAAWTAVRAFDEAAEWACDDLVVSKGNIESREAYPSVLIRIAEFEIEPFPVSVAARGGTLATRIRRLLQPRFTEESTMTKMLIPTLLCGLACFQGIRIYAVADDVDAPPPIFLSNTDGAVFGEPQEFTFVGPDEEGSGIESKKFILPTIRQPQRAENVQLHFQVVTDSNDNLAEFESLKNGNVLLTNAKHFAANLRILKKNRLVKSETVPAISCKSGQRSSFELEGIRVRVTPSFANDVHVTLKTEITSAPSEDSSNQPVALVKSGQAAVYRAGSGTYVVIAPAFTDVPRNVDAKETIRKTSSQETMTRVYAVADLLSKDEAANAPYPASSLDDLVEVITEKVLPKSWDDVGGMASIQGFPQNGSIVVQQTEPGHVAVASLLVKLRQDTK